MYWLGTSKWGKKFWNRVPEEILQGITDNIPICCVFYYTFVKSVCFTINGIFRTLLREPYAEGWCADIFIFWKLFKTKFDNIKGEYGRTITSDSFRELQYWRCPICELINKKNKLNWSTGLRWER